MEMKMKKLLTVLITISMFLMASSAFAETLYKVGIGDVLEINVLQPEKMTNSVAVSPDGSITFPYIGNLPVKGLTLTEIQEEIAGKLKDGYMKYPVVSVFLKESNSRKFFVYGEINHPGVYPFSENTTVLKAIAIAGGFARQSQDIIVKVLRPKANGSGNEIIKTNITEIMENNSEKEVLIQSGDTVIVIIPPVKEIIPIPPAPISKFFVYGEVNRPGVFELEEKTTILKAIAIAGGFTKYGSSSRVKVLRPNKDAPGYETISINVNLVMSGSSKEDILLKNGDTVVVSEGMF